MLTIRLLGGMEVVRGDDALPLPPSKKTRALLAYLAATNRPHRREWLCELLWDLPDDPRGALRWSLSKIRPLVDEPDHPRLITDKQTVALDTTGMFVDVLAVKGDLVAATTAASSDAVQRAAAVFRGEFLADLDLPECHHFRSWSVAMREDTRELQIHIFTRLAELLAATPDAALPYARDLVRIDPYSEPAWALLIRLLGAAGRRQEAAQQYETGTRVLKEVGGPSGALIRVWRAARGASSPASGAEPEGSENEGTQKPPVAAPSPRQQKIRFCVTQDNIRIAYATSGNGPPLVKPANWLTHLEYDWESPVWRHWIRELSRDRSLIRYDERANGLSDWDVGDLSFDALMLDLEAVIDATGLRRFPMLGISQGCAFAIAYAIRYPERVSHLVLYGGYARGWAMRGVPEEIVRRRALGMLIQHGWGQDNPAFRQVFTSLFIPEASVEQMRWFNDLQRMTASPQNAFRLHETFGDVEIRSLLPQVRTPTLVLHSRDDGVVPFEEGRLFATTIPNARFVSLQSRNHILLESEPAWERFLFEVRAFLDSETPG
jgi:DNA-binding SARP family transcriptional activator/pimeloyl-ACP methyl ester carboxylesterase